MSAGYGSRHWICFSIPESCSILSNLLGGNVFYPGVVTVVTLVKIINSENDNGITIEHYDYTDGDSGISIEHYKIIGGEHIWFDINYQGANTSRSIWNYVSKYDINGLRLPNK